jgi:hypothetical protein
MNGTRTVGRLGSIFHANLRSSGRSPALAATGSQKFLLGRHPFCHFGLRSVRTSPGTSPSFQSPSVAGIAHTDQGWMGEGPRAWSSRPHASKGRWSPSLPSTAADHRSELAQPATDLHHRLGPCRTPVRRASSVMVSLGQSTTVIQVQILARAPTSGLVPLMVQHGACSPAGLPAGHMVTQPRENN